MSERLLLQVEVACCVERPRVDKCRYERKTNTHLRLEAPTRPRALAAALNAFFEVDLLGPGLLGDLAQHLNQLCVLLFRLHHLIELFNGHLAFHGCHPLLKKDSPKMEADSLVGQSDESDVRVKCPWVKVYSNWGRLHLVLFTYSVQDHYVFLNTQWCGFAYMCTEIP